MTPVCWKPPRFVMRPLWKLEAIFNTTLLCVQEPLDKESLFCIYLYFEGTKWMCLPNCLLAGTKRSGFDPSTSSIVAGSINQQLPHLLQNWVGRKGRCKKKTIIENLKFFVRQWLANKNQCFLLSTGGNCFCSVTECHHFPITISLC